VGFRYFVVREASSLGITGFARNIEAGDGVEIVAYGSPQNLERFVARLWTGPAGARVTDVTTQQIDPLAAYPDFTIHH